MNKTARKKTSERLTKRQAYPLIEEYLRSGLTPLEFYTKVGWTDNQFFSWRKRYMEEHDLLREDTPPADFHPITITSEAEQTFEEKSDEFTIEITYPNGVSLKVYSKNTAQLVDLIKLY